MSASAPYRAPGEVEPEPDSASQERVEAPWVARVAIGGMMLAGALLIGMVMCAAQSCDEQMKADAAATTARQKSFADAWSVRQRAAEAWLTRNGVVGHVTCFTNVPRCDVIPKDARAPFKITCRAEDGGVCELE